MVIAVIVVLVAAIAVVAIILIRYRLGFKTDVSLHKNYCYIFQQCVLLILCLGVSRSIHISLWTVLLLRTYVCFLNISFLVYFCFFFSILSSTLCM